VSMHTMFVFQRVVGTINPFPTNVYPELKSLRIDFGEHSDCLVHDMVPRCISLNIRQGLTEAHPLVDAVSQKLTKCALTAHYEMEPSIAKVLFYVWY